MCKLNNKKALTNVSCNLKNSIDYPAMYEDVVGCGFLNGILYKEKDVVYESNKLIICNDNTIDKRGRKMKEVILNWTYYYDKIVCPDFVAEHLSDYQIKFDEWINQPENEERYLVKTEDGEEALCFNSDAFVDWLNECMIGNGEKAVYVQRDILKKGEMRFKLPTINF